MRITCEGREVGAYPLDDIMTLIVSARSATLSKPLLVALSERGSTILVCGDNYTPALLCAPISGNAASGKRIHAQIEASKPLRKRLWQAFVKEKISNQALILDTFGVTGKASRLRELAKVVSSGDKENREAQAARVYWPALMGKEFRRDPDKPGVNSMLNYGYAILRAMFARAIASVGLLPSEGIHHCHNDFFALADDLMEPYRPFVDWLVYNSRIESNELTPAVKLRISSIARLGVVCSKGISPLSIAARDIAMKLCEAFMIKKHEIPIPKVAGASSEWILDWSEADSA